MSDRHTLSAAIAALSAAANTAQFEFDNNIVEFEDNPIFDTDSYKPSQWLQLPEDTARVVAYLEARGIAGEGETIPFGFNYHLRRYMMGRRITMKHIDEAEVEFAIHGIPFNRAGFERIVKVHNGYWPIHVMSVQEGKPVPRGTPLLVMYNTDPELPWVTTYVETQFLRPWWYGTTVATSSYESKKVIMNAMEASCDNMDKLPFMLHDFGARGVSSLESAAVGGAAHMLNFCGTDTLVALKFINQYYRAQGMSRRIFGLSIPAGEHSTMTSWGGAGELAAFKNMMKRFLAPGKLVAWPIDSYDMYNAADNLIGVQLKNEIMASGGTVVARPDSGDATRTLPRLLNSFDVNFGSRVNGKKFKVLPDCIRLIQGDGVTRRSLPTMIDAVLNAGYSIDNLAFGQGGGLLQHVNRDDYRFAFKASLRITKSGECIPMFKDPITDPGKRSKSGFPFTYEEFDGTQGWMDITECLQSTPKWQDLVSSLSFMVNLNSLDDVLNKRGAVKGMNTTYFCNQNDVWCDLEAPENDFAALRKNTGLWDSPLVDGIEIPKASNLH